KAVGRNVASGARPSIALEAGKLLQKQLFPMLGISTGGGCWRVVPAPGSERERNRRAEGDESTVKRVVLRRCSWERSNHYCCLSGHNPGPFFIDEFVCFVARHIASLFRTPGNVVESCGESFDPLTEVLAGSDGGKSGVRMGRLRLSNSGTPAWILPMDATI